MPDLTKRRKAPSILRLLFTAMAVSFVISIAGVTVVAFGLAPQIAVYSLLGLIVGGVTLWLVWRWWVAVDEAVREAHKTSWFWGGSVGLVVVGVAALPLSSISSGEVARFGLSPSEAGFMLAGIAFTVLVMLVGYLVWWAGWWFVRSR